MHDNPKTKQLAFKESSDAGNYHWESTKFSFVSDQSMEGSTLEKEKISPLCCSFLYLLLGLFLILALASYAFSVMTLVCHTMDHYRKVQLNIAPSAKHDSYSNNNNSGNNSSPEAEPPQSHSCPTAGPLEYFWNISIEFLMLLNAVATILFIQALLIVRHLAASSSCCRSNKDFEQKKRPKPRWNKDQPGQFAVSEREPCHLHLQDFILRVTYKTRCQDDLIIRVEIPNVPEQQIAVTPGATVEPDHVIEPRESPRSIVKIPVSLFDSGPLEIKQDDVAPMQVDGGEEAMRSRRSSHL